MKHEHITDEDREWMQDTGLPNDVHAFMQGQSKAEFMRSVRKSSATARAKASRKYRKYKYKDKNDKRFGKPHACYHYWTDQEIKKIMSSKYSDDELAQLLGVTVYAIHKKRERVKKKESRNDQA